MGGEGGWEKAKGKIAPIAISQVRSPYKADSTRHLSVMTRLSAISLPYVFNSLRGRHDWNLHALLFLSAYVFINSLSDSLFIDWCWCCTEFLWEKVSFKSCSPSALKVSFGRACSFTYLLVSCQIRATMGDWWWLNLVSVCGIPLWCIIWCDNSASYLFLM